MTRKGMEVAIGGQLFRVVSSNGPDELNRCVETVEGRVRGVIERGGATPMQALVLVALQLAQERDTQAARADRLASGAQGMIQSLLTRVEEALGRSDEHGDPLE